MLGQLPRHQQAHCSNTTFTLCNNTFRTQPHVSAPSAKLCWITSLGINKRTAITQHLHCGTVTCFCTCLPALCCTAAESSSLSCSPCKQLTPLPTTLEWTSPCQRCKRNPPIDKHRELLCVKLPCLLTSFFAPLKRHDVTA